MNLGSLLFLQKAVHFLISTHEQHVLSVKPDIERSAQSTNSPEIDIIKNGPLTKIKKLPNERKYKQFLRIKWEICREVCAKYSRHRCCKFNSF
jgi:hypothetical protein